MIDKALGRKCLLKKYSYSSEILTERLDKIMLKSLEIIGNPNMSPVSFWYDPLQRLVLLWQILEDKCFTKPLEYKVAAP